MRVTLDGDTARKADRWDMRARIRFVGQGQRGEVYLLETVPAGGCSADARSLPQLQSAGCGILPEIGLYSLQAAEFLVRLLSESDGR